MPEREAVRVALLDLNNGVPNQGMRCLREMLRDSDRKYNDVPLMWDEFDVRVRDEVPGLDYDIYISSGGPGSPFEGENMRWERDYFRWLDALWNHNERASQPRKHALFICHSFELMCRFFEVAELRERKIESFGIYPVNPTPEGQEDPLFQGLGDPFYAADFRSWQAVEPASHRLEALGGTVLAIEEHRAHGELERALMALRLSPEIAGTQFHPEADPEGMLLYFGMKEKRRAIVEKYGEERYQRLLHRTAEPDYLARTHENILPNFLRLAVEDRRPESLAKAA